MRTRLSDTGLQGRAAFTFVTSIGILIPLAVAGLGMAYSEARLPVDLPGIDASAIDPIEASLWFCALWIAITRQLRRRAVATAVAS